MSDGETTIIKQFSDRADALKKPTRILVVDDCPTDLELAVREINCLPAGTFELEACESGKEAMALIEANAYDLILLDIRMPGMNGVDVMKSLRDKNLKPRVVLMTGLTNGPLVEEALHLGAIMHILKPLTLEHLKQTLQLLKL